MLATDVNFTKGEVLALLEAASRLVYPGGVRIKCKCSDRMTLYRCHAALERQLPCSSTVYLEAGYRPDKPGGSPEGAISRACP
jgi:hypothetical protein